MAKRGRIASFIEPMECLPVEEIPEGEPWTYELKLDGYRLVAVKAAGKVTLYSRRGTDLSRRFRSVTAALSALPDETVIDGELVAIDEQGKPNFNLLQNFRSSESHIMFYAFDMLVRCGEDLTKQTLSKRREILDSTIQPHDHVGISQVSHQVDRSYLIGAGLPPFSHFWNRLSHHSVTGFSGLVPDLGAYYLMIQFQHSRGTRYRSI